MRRASFCLTAAAVAWAGLIGSAHGQAAEFAPTHTSQSTARVVTRGDAYVTATRHIPLNLPEHRRIRLIVEDQPVGATVVTKSSVEQRQAPDRLRLQVVNSTIELDPYRNYLHEGNGPIEANSMIPRAQSLWQSQVGNKAKVVRNPRYIRIDEAAEPQQVRPLRTIILRTPHHMKHEDPNQDAANDKPLWRAATGNPATAG
jgi:hypothetical protein